ncbi:MAG: BrnT family toxin [Nitrospirae bacterium]|nr:BrnT family toxin [Nitrospirota bacterium]
MADISFEWDRNKNSQNKKKHGISFEEGQTVFVDENALLLHDPDHSEEDRFILLGLSSSRRILVVCHCYRKNDEAIRIISARKATRSEQKQYWKRW